MDKLTKSLVDFIRVSYIPQEKTKELKDGGQTVFFRKGGKSLCYIEAKDGKSVCTVVIGESLNDKVRNANISKEIKEKFTKAKQFFDGKWLFIEVKTSKDVEDIKTLLAIKRPLKSAS